MNSPVAVVLVAALVLATVTLAAPPKDATYSTKYDHLDVDAILNNPRALSSYIKCIMDDGPCSPEGREFRKNLPDALQTHCAKCSDPQKQMIRKISKHLMEHNSKEWDSIKKKYDPKGEYHESFTKFLKGD